MNRLPTVTLLITAGTYAGFALWLGTTPEALLAAFGIEATTPGMRTEIRAFYGGLELGLAAAMLVLWRRGDLAAALLVGGLPLLGSAAGRLLGQIADGPAGLHLAFAALEAFGGGLCLLAATKVGDELRSHAPREEAEH